MSTAISIENVHKSYRLGSIGGAELKEDFARWWAKMRGRADPLAKVGEEHQARRMGEEFWALRGIDFKISEGEVLGIIGRNGAGKSTLLKILSQITAPTSGEIKIRGRIASLLEVGTGFHPDLTGRENVFLNGAILGMARSEIVRKFDEIIDFSGIEDFIDTPVKRYSSGMYVRLAFAVAAHLEPEILIVDEVLAVGDAEFQKKCIGKMKDAHRGGRTVLFVSHNMGAISQLCTRAVLLAGGRLQEIGATRDVIEVYYADSIATGSPDLSSFRLEGYGGEIRLTRLELLNGSNLGYNETLRLEMEVQSRRALEGLSLGSSLYDGGGQCIGSLLTEESFSIGANASAILRLDVRKPRLAPGRYRMGVSIGRGGRDGNRVDYDVVIGQPAFQITPVSVEDGFVSNWSASWGSIIFDQCALTVQNSHPDQIEKEAAVV